MVGEHCVLRAQPHADQQSHRLDPLTAWRPGRVWEGRLVVVVATGASFSASDARLLGIARAQGNLRVLAIKDTVYPLWFADLCYACDDRWWKWHQGLPTFQGRKVRLAVRGADGLDINDPGFPDIEAIEKTGTIGVEHEPGKITSAASSGGQAIQIAEQLGAGRILLLGFDGFGSHFFGEHPYRAIVGAWPTRQQRMLEIARGLAERVEIMNVTPGSQFAGFARGDLAKELAKLEKRP